MTRKLPTNREVREAVARLYPPPQERPLPAHWRTVPPARCGWCCRDDYDCVCKGGDR